MLMFVNTFFCAKSLFTKCPFCLSFISIFRCKFVCCRLSGSPFASSACQLAFLFYILSEFMCVWCRIFSAPFCPAFICFALHYPRDAIQTNKHQTSAKYSWHVSFNLMSFVDYSHIFSSKVQETMRWQLFLIPTNYLQEKHSAEKKKEFACWNVLSS